ncbi:MAG: thioesterase family protein [Nitriliruptorales bacterium]|nr:thioesterase family protein [Nitriliruptorales bacterium]
MVDRPGTLFHRDGANRFVPTEWCRGPWDPDALHAGSSSALLAHLVDGHASLSPMRIMRLSYDILRPVPLAPLDVELHVDREGKRIQIVSAVLSADGVEVQRLRALRMRRGDVSLPLDGPRSASLADVGLSPVEEMEEFGVPDLGDVVFFAHAMEMRATGLGLLSEPGPGASWFRLRFPVVDDQEATPTARVAATADFGNGLGPPVPFQGWIYLNADLQVMLQREPVDEWVGMVSSSIPADDGTALTTSQLVDRSGQIGIATQSLFIEPRT